MKIVMFANPFAARLAIFGLACLMTSSLATTKGLYGWQGSATREAAAAAIGAGSQPERWVNVDPANRLVPLVLLPLVHTVEVQKELGLDDSGRQRLEQLFSEIDGPWFRSRTAPEAEQRAEIARLESQLMNGLAQWLPAEKLRRLQQLELQAQASRLVHRGDVAGFLRLDEAQSAQFRTLAETTDNLVREIAEAAQAAKPIEDAASKLKKAREAETSEIVRLMRDDQLRGLAQITGEPMNVAAFSRIYPMAPELIDSDGWVGNSPVSLAESRGKVVLVHFYAFQCINCQRNLPRYNDWVSQFARDDVVVIGIQRPETEAEKDPDLIREAARQEKIEYPVLLDLQSKNWAAWSNTIWPTVYVIDRQGYIRYWWQGELNWQGATGDKQIADLVKQLLKESPKKPSSK